MVRVVGLERLTAVGSHALRVYVQGYVDVEHSSVNDWALCDLDEMRHDGFFDPTVTNHQVAVALNSSMAPLAAR